MTAARSLEFVIAVLAVIADTLALNEAAEPGVSDGGGLEKPRRVMHLFDCE